ncbi:hypothetical protein AMELA_G00031440, partial [Ameiurus melas]
RKCTAFSRLQSVDVRGNQLNRVVVDLEPIWAYRQEGTPFYCRTSHTFTHSTHSHLGQFSIGGPPAFMFFRRSDENAQKRQTRVVT